MKVESYHLHNWEEEETGILLAENDDWILIHSIPNDYALDGYKVIRKSAIAERVNGLDELLVERVLRLKEVTAEVLGKFEFGTALQMIRWVESEYDLFELQDHDEEDCVYGQVKDADEGFVELHWVEPDGTIDHEAEFEIELDMIRIIAFNSDYHYSVRLLWQDNQK
jgi:hypothetical protein